MSKAGRSSSGAPRPAGGILTSRENAARTSVDVHDNSDTVEILAGPDHPLGPGDKIDRYEIVRLIGMGGMARVYEAVHDFTGRVVAIKVMHARYSRRPDVIERFHKEAVALSMIDHPNVVAVDNGGLTDDGLVFIAMELLQGQTLREMLRERERLPLTEVLSILMQVAQGVAAAHDLKVIHRDLKPENIFCTKDGSVKVLDLGIAKLIGYDAKETDPNPASIIGTVAYMAPERLEARPAGVGADIYALGVIAYECIAGYHPLAPHGDWPSPSEVAHRALAYLPPPLKDVPPELSKAVECAMHKSPSKRYQNMRDFERVLREIRDRLVLEQAPDATPSADGRNRLAAFMRESVSGSFANAILGSSAASVMTPARRSLKSIGLVVGCVLIAGASFAAALQLKAELPSVAANTAELSHGMRLVADYADVSSTWFLIARTAHLNPAASAPTAHLAVQPAVPPSSAPAPQSVRALSGASHHPRAPVAALDLMTSRKTPDFSKSGEAQVTGAASSPAHIESSARPAPSSATIGNGTPHAAPPRTPAPKPAKPKHILPKSGL